MLDASVLPKGKQHQRGARRAKIGVAECLLLGIRGIVDEGRSQNLVAIAMAAHTLSSFAFRLRGNTQSPPSRRHRVDLRSCAAAGRGSRSTQVPPIASAPPHGSSSGRWHPVEWASTLLGDERTSSHVPIWRRGSHRFSGRTAVLVLQLQNSKGEYSSLVARGLLRFVQRY
jgi:hypothetical protein